MGFRLQVFRASGFQGPRVSGLQGLRVSDAGLCVLLSCVWGAAFGGRREGFETGTPARGPSFWERV